MLEKKKKLSKQCILSKNQSLKKIKNKKLLRSTGQSQRLNMTKNRIISKSSILSTKTRRSPTARSINNPKSQILSKRNKGLTNTQIIHPNLRCKFSI